MSDARLTVVIDGILDPRLQAQVEQAIRAAFWRVTGPGQWIVAVAPAEQRGRWDVGVKSDARRHVFSVSGNAAALPDMLRDRIADAFDRLGRDA